MSETMVIQSHMGPYKVYFQEDALESLNSRCPQNVHYIIDQTTTIDEAAESQC